jgi:hypothetical protein
MTKTQQYADLARYSPQSFDVDDEELRRAWSLEEGNCSLIMVATIGLANAISVASSDKNNISVEIGIAAAPTHLSHNPVTVTPVTGKVDGSTSGVKA